MTQVAVLGAGRMGTAMARRLASQGHAVVVWDRTPDKAGSVGVGDVCETPAEATRRSELVISMLTNADAVRAVYLGSNGVAEASAGRLVVNSSTSGPWVLPELRTQIERAGGRLLDAPVLGAPPAVESGSLTILLGGDEADARRAESTLEALGHVRYVGPLGTASQLKLIANSLLATIMAAGAELVEAGSALGIDEGRVLSVLAGLAPALGARQRQLLERAVDPPLFTVSDLVKDLDMSLAQAHAAGAAMPETALARELFGKAAREHAGSDIAAIRSIFD